MATTFDAIRDEREQLLYERETLLARLPAHAETIERFRTACLAMGEGEGDGDARLLRVVKLAAHGSANVTDVFRVRAEYGLTDLGPMLRLLFGPDVMVQGLARALSTLEEGPAAADRAAQLDELNAKIIDAEVREEREIRRVESLTGMRVPRRPDADPRLVAAADLKANARRRA